MLTFSQHSRLTGAVTAVIDNSHLSVEVRRPFRKPVSFAVDVAVFAPACLLAAAEGIWITGIATLATAALGGLALYGLVRGELLSTGAWQVIAVVSLLGTTTLALRFRLCLFRRVVLRTRYAGTPLLAIPVLSGKRADMEVFLATLRLQVGEAETKRNLGAERLRSGELKTLRRLAEEKVIPLKTYEAAKALILSR